MAHHDITDQQFDEKVIKSDKPVLVDFWATWCGPCQVQGPILDDVAAAIGNSAVVAKVNVDENPASAQQYGVMSIPTLFIFHKGKVVKQFVGVQSKETLVDELQKFIT